MTYVSGKCARIVKNKPEGKRRLMKSVVKLAIALIVIILVSAMLIYIIRTGNFFKESLPRIDGSKVLVVMTDGFDETEYFSVVDALVENGATVKTASFEIKELYGDHGGGPVTPNMTFSEVNIPDFDAIFIPGGKSPENILRNSANETVLAMIEEADEKGLILAAICHGPWILAKANVIEGKHVVGHSETISDLEAVGGIITLNMVEKDGNIITAQYEGLKEFKKTLILSLANRTSSNKSSMDK